MRRFLMVVLLTAGVSTSGFGESTVILKSGETLQGDIISDTNDVLSVEAHNANRTISFQRDISHADIQSIQTENTAQIAERSDYEALSKYQLNPNQEQSAGYSSQAIAAFQRFPTNYPKSDKAASIQQSLAAWQAELKHVSDGEVKFADKWMTPAEKAPLVENWQKQMNVQTAQNALKSIKKKLSELQRQRDELAKNLALAQGNLSASQEQLGGLQDSKVPVYNATTVPFQPHYDQHGHWIESGLAQSSQTSAGSTTVSNPERAGVQGNIDMYQQQITTGQKMLSNLDAKIQGVVQLQIPKAEQDYKTALAQLSPPPPPVDQSMASKSETPPPPPRQ